MAGARDARQMGYRRDLAQFYAGAYTKIVAVCNGATAFFERTGDLRDPHSSPSRRSSDKEPKGGVRGGKGMDLCEILEQYSRGAYLQKVEDCAGATAACVNTAALRASHRQRCQGSADEEPKGGVRGGQGMDRCEIMEQYSRGA